MPRNMSFFYTQEQIRNRSKTVTRRLGWTFLNAGDIVNACVKCQGLGKGGKIEKICQIRVTDVRQENLHKMAYDSSYGKREAIKEDFPSKSGRQFVAMFCSHMKCAPESKITRIEFEYVEKSCLKNKR